MQTHQDLDAQSPTLGDQLRLKSIQMTAEKLNEITAGKEGEKEVSQSVGQFQITQRPDDFLALRVSIGEINSGELKFGEPSAYLVFRGNPGDVEELISRALNAFRASHFEQMGSQIEN